MSIEPIAFVGLAVVLLASSLAVVLTRNLFHSVLYLALSLTATAGVFLSLDAEFLAAVQLLLDKDRLHALGLAHEPSWATGNRLRDMQAPPKPAKAAGPAEAAAGGKAEAKEPAE